MLEVHNAAAVGPVVNSGVKSGVVVGARRFGVQLALAAGGRVVQRDTTASPRTAHMVRPAAGGFVCYGYGGKGHLRRDC